MKKSSCFIVFPSSSLLRATFPTPSQPYRRDNDLSILVQGLPSFCRKCRCCRLKFLTPLRRIKYKIFKNGLHASGRQSRDDKKVAWNNIGQQFSFELNCNSAYSEQRERKIYALMRQLFINNKMLAI